MGTALGLFFDKFKIYIVLALLAIMAAMVVYHVFEVGMLKSEVKAEQKRNGELVIENSALVAANKKAKEDIVTQNKAVIALTTENAEMSKRAKEMMDEVKKKEAKWQNRYNGIFTGKPPGTDDCTNTFSLLDNYQSVRMDELKEVRQ